MNNGLALSLIRHIPFYDRSTLAGTWSYQAIDPLRHPGNLMLKIARVARIGRKVAQLARPCSGQMLGYDPYSPASTCLDKVQPVALAALFQQSNIVSLHMLLTTEPVNPGNADLLNQGKI